jgi:hypothetical protein
VGELKPGLLRRFRRHLRPRRLLFVCVLSGLLLAAPNAAGVPGDETPPEVTPTIFGTVGSAGWYRSNVTVNWSISDPESIILDTECDTATTLTVDTSGTKLTCWAKSDGGETTKSVTIKLDKTPPAVVVAPERPPDANGWYNRPLSVYFGGTDATSGMGGCGAGRYYGPDNPGASVTGSCSDVAGNTASRSLPFQYDATGPTVFAVSAKGGNRSADISWRMSSDTVRVDVVRAPGKNGQGESVIYSGQATGVPDTGLTPGRKYEYRVIATDGAANRTEHRVDLTATGALVAPLPGTVVSGRPTLAWSSVPKASYYNVQLVRGRKVYSAWPARTSLRLPRTWTYNGRRYRLRPGVYRWYVWPGFGKISAAKYGKLLGGSTFVVR